MWTFTAIDCLDYNYPFARLLTELTITAKYRFRLTRFIHVYCGNGQSKYCGLASEKLTQVGSQLQVVSIIYMYTSSAVVGEDTLRGVAEANLQGAVFGKFYSSRALNLSLLWPFYKNAYESEIWSCATINIELWIKKKWWLMWDYFMSTASW